jgi:hypothetical protein
MYRRGRHVKAESRVMAVSGQRKREMGKNCLISMRFLFAVRQ